MFAFLNGQLNSMRFRAFCLAVADGLLAYPA